MSCTDAVRSSRYYPRTGRRGVPQQFPRKLYDMLEAESTGTESCCVQWSSSGQGFLIADVSLFSTEILPKYFKTTKFSSFQRNLNLYGFTKKSRKRGPEVDGYSHPGFVRGNCEGLSLLRKRTKTKSITQKNQTSSISSPTPGSTSYAPSSYGFQSLRVISPTNSTDDISSVSSNSSLDGQSPRHQGRRNSEGLAMLADAMLMMIGEE